MAGDDRIASAAFAGNLWIIHLCAGKIYRVGKTYSKRSPWMPGLGRGTIPAGSLKQRQKNGLLETGRAKGKQKGCRALRSRQPMRFRF
jgi:hypothetical protein